MVKCKRNYVEIGRIVYIRMGKYRNSLAVITDVVDQNWIFCDGRAFENGMDRGCVNVKDISLTHLKIKLNYLQNLKDIKKRLAADDVVAKWNKTLGAKKMAAQRAKRGSTDLERWRVQYNKKQRSVLIKAKFGKLKKKV